MSEQYPKFNLSPFSPEFINKIVSECITRDMLYDTIHDVQRVLIILELPEYRAHNPEYSKDNIRTIVANFTSIFRALLLEKAKPPIGSEKAKIIYTAYGND